MTQAKRLTGVLSVRVALFGTEAGGSLLRLSPGLSVAGNGMCVCCQVCCRMRPFQDTPGGRGCQCGEWERREPAGQDLQSQPIRGMDGWPDPSVPLHQWNKCSCRHGLLQMCRETGCDSAPVERPAVSCQCKNQHRPEQVRVAPSSAEGGQEGQSGWIRSGREAGLLAAVDAVSYPPSNPILCPRGFAQTCASD